MMCWSVISRVFYFIALDKIIQTPHEQYYS
jgi:hypothetical protein